MLIDLSEDAIAGICKLVEMAPRYLDKYHKTDSAALIATLRSAAPVGEVWEPVRKDYRHCPDNDCVTTLAVIKDGTALHASEWDTVVIVPLPSHIRLCQRRRPEIDDTLAAELDTGKGE